METYEFSKASQAYEEALSLFFDYDNAREYAYFSKDQDRIEKVITLNQKMLQSRLSKSEKTKILINLAVQYQRKNQFENAENLYYEALELLTYLKGKKRIHNLKSNSKQLIYNFFAIALLFIIF